MKKLPILLISGSILLGACNMNEDSDEPAAPMQSIEDLSMHDQKELEKDKEKTTDQLKMSNKEANEYENLTKNLSKKQRNQLEKTLLSEKQRYYYMKNLNQSINSNANYIIIAKNNNKFKELYKQTINQIAKKDKNAKIEVYLPNGESEKFDSKNITVKHFNDINNQFNNLTIKETPTLFKIKNKKIEQNLVGYFDYDIIKQKFEQLKDVK